MNDLPHNMAELLSQLRNALGNKGRGSRAALAKHIEVSAVTLDRWLSDPPKRHPDGERTLALLSWLAEQQD